MKATISTVWIVLFSLCSSFTSMAQEPKPASGRDLGAGLERLQKDIRKLKRQLTKEGLLQKTDAIKLNEKQQAQQAKLTKSLTKTNQKLAKLRAAIDRGLDPALVAQPLQNLEEKKKKLERELNEFSRSVRPASKWQQTQSKMQELHSLFGSSDESQSVQTQSGSTQKNSKAAGKASWTDRVKLKGDLRYRVEFIDKSGKPFRNRHRVRARLGVKARLVDDITAVVGLGSGGSNDPVSNNQSLSKSFSSKPLWIDLAYIDWHPSLFKGLHVYGGKVKNPFYRPAKTELLWDPDLNPEGLGFSFRKSIGLFEPFVNGAGLWIEERKEEDDALVYGAQAGIRLNLASDLLYVLVAVSYVDFTGTQGLPLFHDADDSKGNSTEEVDGNLVYQNDYDELQFTGEIGGRIMGMPWAVFSDNVINLAADNDNVGWLVGGVLGKCKKPYDFKIRYIYREMQKDAVVGIFSDSDFVGGGTDGKGHEVNFSLQLGKHTQFAGTYFLNKAGLDDLVDYHRAQFDIKLKF